MWLKLLWDLAALALWLRALVLVARRPATEWAHGWLGKVAASAVVLMVAPTIRGVSVPVGAMLVWWRVRRHPRDPFEVPMADGRRRR